MSFNALLLQSVAIELKKSLLGARVDKVYQPDKSTVILELRLPGENLHLLLSAHPQLGRIHLTGIRPAGPPTPSSFCMLLRKHLEKHRLDDITAVPFERVVHLHFSRDEDYGRTKARKTLVLEIMGKHSNLIVLDEDGVVVDALFRIDESKSRVRQILPKIPYSLPPAQKKKSPHDLTLQELSWFLEVAGPDRWSEALVKNIRGISPDVARQIITGAGGLAASPEKIHGIIGQLVELSEEGRLVPRIESESLVFYPPGSGQINTVLDSYYTRMSEQDKLLQQKSSLLAVVRGHLNRSTKKLSARNEALENAQKKEEYRRKGDLLTASLHLIKKGMSLVEVPDYYAEGQPLVAIELDPSLTPNQNAQNYYKRYNKARSALENLDRLLEETENEIAYLENLSGLIEAAKDLADVESLKEELKSEGYLKEKETVKTNKKSRGSLDAPRRYLTPSGNEIVVGRNNKQNDTIRRQALGEFWWFHTQKVPGSHVVLRSAEPLPEDFETAAMLAAVFSKASTDSVVFVDSARVKRVRKPQGAKPGFVTYDNEKTYTVKPDESVLFKLKELK